VSSRCSTAPLTLSFRLNTEEPSPARGEGATTTIAPAAQSPERLLLQVAALGLFGRSLRRSFLTGGPPTTVGLVFPRRDVMALLGRAMHGLHSTEPLERCRHAPWDNGGRLHTR